MGLVRVEMLPQVREFVEGLVPQERSRVDNLFSQLEARGRITDPSKCRRLEGWPLWNLKAYQIRLFGEYRPGGRFVILHAFRKKQLKTPNCEIHTAMARLRELN